MKKILKTIDFNQGFNLIILRLENVYRCKGYLGSRIMASLKPLSEDI